MVLGRRNYAKHIPRLFKNGSPLLAIFRQVRQTNLVKMATLKADREDNSARQRELYTERVSSPSKPLHFAWCRYRPFTGNYVQLQPTLTDVRGGGRSSLSSESPEPA